VVAMTAEIALPPPGSAAGDSLRRMHPVALVAALTAVTIPIMSFFSINVALGEIGSDLGAGPGLLQLVVAAYGVVYASLVVIGGRLGDGFGRKRMLVAGLAGFAVTSLLCAVVQTPEQLVGARLLQGTSAALVAPQVLATIHASTDGHHRDRAIAWFGATAGIATSLAFLVGGTMAGSDATWLGWRSIFWVNAPVAAVVLLAVLRYFPETKAPSRTSLDLGGTVLLAAAMTLLIGPLTEGRALGWPAWTWICLAAFPPVVAAFVWWQGRLERRGGLPLVPMSLFRFRSISAGLGVAAPFFIAFGGFMFVYAYVTQSAGMTPFRVGLSLLPMSVAFLAASLAAGRLVPRYGAKVLTVGSVINLVGYVGVGWAVSARDGVIGVGDVLVPMMVMGVGLGLVMPSLMGIVLSQVHGHMAGLGSGVLITTQQACLGLGSAVVGSLYLTLANDAGPATGFLRTTVVLAVALALVAGLTRVLEPRRAR
jgi:MFS family permease